MSLLLFIDHFYVLDECVCVCVCQSPAAGVWAPLVRPLTGLLDEAALDRPTLLLTTAEADVIWKSALLRPRPALLRLPSSLHPWWLLPCGCLSGWFPSLLFFIICASSACGAWRVTSDLCELELKPPWGSGGLLWSSQLVWCPLSFFSKCNIYKLRFFLLWSIVTHW